MVYFLSFFFFFLSWEWEIEIESIFHSRKIKKHHQAHILPILRSSSGQDCGVRKTREDDDY